MMNIEVIPVRVGEANSPCIAKYLVRFYKIKFVIYCTIGNTLVLNIVHCKNKTLLLFFVDVWNLIDEFKFSLKTKLSCQNQIFSAASHIVMASFYSIVYPVEIVVIILPPFIEIAI